MNIIWRMLFASYTVFPLLFTTSLQKSEKDLFTVDDRVSPETAARKIGIVPIILVISVIDRELVT